MKYPIILCEDDLLQLHQLERVIDKFILFHDEIFEVVLSAQKPSEVEAYLKQFHPKQGIYFLDVDLKAEMDGMELAQMIRKHDVQAKIIFVTTHDEVLPITFKRKLEALGFVQKDQDYDEYKKEIVELLLLAQERIDAAKVSKNQAFVFSIGSQTFTFDINDIYFLEASSMPHRLSLITKNGQFEFYGKLTDFEEKYEALTRINRSCLANLKNVQKTDFKAKEVYFTEDVHRSFSSSKTKSIKAFLNTMF